MSGIRLTKALGPSLKLDESDRMRAHLIHSAIFPFSGGEGRGGGWWGEQVRAVLLAQVQ